MKTVYGPPCMTHNVQHPVEIPTESEKAYDAWYTGTVRHVQSIPGLTADQREILLTGTCQEAWDANFPADDCTEDCDGSSHPGLFCR